jgi:acyl-coenzyme A synthetase/AMP-(fatty) acid ligase
MQEITLPANDAPFALFAGRIISRGNLWADVEQMANYLPERPYVLNLCENRYLFCLTMLAAARLGQVCLLPPSGQQAVALEILADYPNAYIACEQDPGIGQAQWFKVAASDSTAPAEAPAFTWERPALIVFTSGSTGKPKPCLHSLATFKRSAQMALARLALQGKRRLMVSTTPPQHMYGLETSVFWPLFSDLVMHDGRPFYPQDIRHAIESSPWQAVLASTPTHLRSLVQADLSWPRLVGVISATDALPETLARAVGTSLCPTLFEIYGSTETLSFASRQPLRETLWRLYDGASLTVLADGQNQLLSPHLPEPVCLHDQFQNHADGCFAVLGRPSDLIKIGGKRSSLAELNRRLKEIDGVEDGFFYLQQAGHQERMAVVVVSRLAKRSIREALSVYVDAVFLPRTVHYVEHLPRNRLGKLPQAEVEKLLKELQAPANP